MADDWAYFLLERFPRISDGSGSFFEWVELFPGIRLWWHKETYSDQELLKSCMNDEHYFALRWIELRSRRLNNGYVCELEIIPDETRRFFEEQGLTKVMDLEVTVQQLFSLFASFCLLLGGYNTQMRACGSMNYSWRFVANPENEFPTKIEFETELTNNDWWGGENEIDIIEVESWESILPMIWMAGYTLFSDSSGRYGDFLEFYIVAMQTENPLERNARFCRCLETLCRGFTGGIGANLRKWIPFLFEISNSDNRIKMNVSDEDAREQDAICKKLIKDAWNIRSKYTHGQTLKNKHHDTCMEVLSDFPKLLYWINRGIIFLSRVPTADEFVKACESDSLDWKVQPKWDPVEYETIEDWLYRIDGTYNPKSIEGYRQICRKEKMSYLEYLDRFGDDELPTD